MHLDRSSRNESEPSAIRDHLRAVVYRNQEHLRIRFGCVWHTTTTSTGPVLLGTWTVGTAGPPSAVSVTPNSGSGLTQTFTATYTDPAGASDIQVVYLQIGLAGGGAYSCFAAYIPSTNGLYLFNDANSAVLGPITPGSSNTVSNSRCTLSGSGGAVTASGNNLIVPFSITFAVHL